MHFHSLYIMNHLYAKFKENPCVGIGVSTPLNNLEIAHKTKLLINKLPLLSNSQIFIMLINVKMSTIICILTFMSMIQVMLFEHEKSINLEPESSEIVRTYSIC